MSTRRAAARLHRSPPSLLLAALLGALSFTGCREVATGGLGPEADRDGGEDAIGEEIDDDGGAGGTRRGGGPFGVKTPDGASADTQGVAPPTKPADGSAALPIDARGALDAASTPAPDARPLTPDAAKDVAVDPPPRTCRGPEACASGENCLAGFCRPAGASCAALKGADPAADDGVYWLRTSGAPFRAYCDMQQKLELCATVEGEHEGVTRDASHLRYRMRALLEGADGPCRIWAVRDTGTGHPLDQLLDAPGLALGTCAALGFKADVSFGACKFGANPGHSACGFGGSDFLKWANKCSGCAMNDGLHPKYVLQGKIYVSTIPWTVDGSEFGRCRTK